jgi:hypothetical protein
MTPTAKLRFVERSQPDYPGANTGRIIRTLQQWWVTPDSFDMITGLPAGEWRDVPLEQEQA